MKSREAIAPATITVAVTGSSKGGSSSPRAALRDGFEHGRRVETVAGTQVALELELGVGRQGGAVSGVGEHSERSVGVDLARGAAAPGDSLHSRGTPRPPL